MEIETSLYGNKPDFAGGTTLYVEKADWDNQALAKASAVIIVGGLGYTLLTFEKAQASHIPVIPLITTGGDARKAYLTMRDAFTKQYGPTHELSRLYERLNDNSLTGEQIA